MLEVNSHSRFARLVAALGHLGRCGCRFAQECWLNEFEAAVLWAVAAVRQLARTALMTVQYERHFYWAVGESDVNDEQ